MLSVYGFYKLVNGLWAKMAALFFGLNPNWADSPLTLKRHFVMLAATKSNFLSVSVGNIAFRKYVEGRHAGRP